MSEGEGKYEEEEEKRALERCKIAAEIAIRAITEECKTVKDTMMEWCPFMGLSPEDVPNDYKEILKTLTKDTCIDFRAIRRFVMAKAWELMEREKLPFREAIKKGWEYARAECGKLGVTI